MKRHAKRKPLKENELQPSESPEGTPLRQAENPKHPETLVTPRRDYPNGQPMAQPTDDELEARREQVKEMRFTMGMNYGEIGRALNISKATVCQDMKIIQKAAHIAPTDESRNELNQEIRTMYRSLRKRHFRVIPSINPRDKPKEYILALDKAGMAVEREEKSLQSAGILASAPLQVQAVGGIQISPTPEALEYCRMLIEKRKKTLDAQPLSLDGPDGDRPDPSKIRR